jgi:pyridoxal biosynthesis lyase PdxS
VMSRTPLPHMRQSPCRDSKRRHRRMAARRADVAAKGLAGISTSWSPEVAAGSGKLPVVLFTAGGIATPADAAMMMQLGAEGVFVGSGIFKSAIRPSVQRRSSKHLPSTTIPMSSRRSPKGLASHGGNQRG